MSCTCAASLCLCPVRFTTAGEMGRLSSIVDRARDVATRVGQRPWRVSHVHVRWTGTRRGDGVEEVVTEREILPRPQIADLGGVTRTLSDAQVEENGTVLITGISAAYSEDQILCRPGTGKPLPPNEAIYYKAQLLDGVRRRLVPIGGAAPGFSPSAGWTVTVTVAAGARPRDGRNR